MTGQLAISSHTLRLPHGMSIELQDLVSHSRISLAAELCEHKPCCLALSLAHMFTPDESHQRGLLTLLPCMHWL